MKQFAIIILSLLFPISVFGQCNEETKKKVDELKSSITYPKYNIGDILYIAFINDPEVSTDNVQDKDIAVYKIKVVDMCVVNGRNYRNSNDGGGMYFSGESSEIEWKYQYIDATIVKPRFGDYSEDFHSENRFSKTREGAIRNLKESLKD